MRLKRITQSTGLPSHHVNDLNRRSGSVQFNGILTFDNGLADNAPEFSYYSCVWAKPHLGQTLNHFYTSLYGIQLRLSSHYIIKSCYALTNIQMMNSVPHSKCCKLVWRYVRLDRLPACLPLLLLSRILYRYANVIGCYGKPYNIPQPSYITMVRMRL